jgi:NAD(P)-dependent dehydrogenase (short-subunit alcohol dehydrogenase family)
MITINLAGKVAAVTGGSSVIGFAAASALAEAGAHVYVMGRRPEELISAVAKIGPNATGVQGDVSSQPDLDRLYAQIETEKGKLDVLMANAGVAKYAPIGSITEELYDTLFGTNVKGLVFTVQKALPLMSEGGSPQPKFLVFHSVLDTFDAVGC